MLSSTILVVQILCLSFWIGGSFVVLTIVGPELLHGEGNDQPLRTRMMRIIRRFNGGFLVAGLILAGTLYLQLAFLSNALGIKLRIALSLVMLAVLLGTYVRLSFFRNMSEDRRTGTLEEQGTTLRKRGTWTGLLTTSLLLGIAVVITLILPYV